ncbi:MAG: MetS family NSS transporter small subunit [Candidatus Thermoplasmatota archaeon]|nr:MetS family NSS transporter small subunit [Candidatus Thermoplasmatota archaeon]
MLPVSAIIMLLVGIIVIYGSLAYFLFIAFRKKKNG